jgi:P27 family predicted phage terminase small subunit
MRGRKPKPTAQRELEGNPGHRALNADEPQLPRVDASLDTPPPELDGHADAIAEWTRLAPMLRKARHITQADRGALIALCLEWSRYLDATRQVAKLGLVVKAPSGYPMTNPFLSIATRALAGCNKLWPELGLTPSSRSRVHTSDTVPLAGDAFSEFDTPLPITPPQRH